MHTTLLAFAALAATIVVAETQDSIGETRAPLVVAIRAAAGWPPASSRIGVSFESKNARPTIPLATHAALVQEALGERGFVYQERELSSGRCGTEECRQRRNAPRIVFGRMSVVGEIAEVTFIVINSGIQSTVGPPILTVRVTRKNGVWELEKLMLGRP